MQNILVVDDDPHIREVVCFALQQAGFQTTEAGDGVSAINLHQTNPADLIVLDILMPELDGLSVCRELRNLSSVPIIFLSSRDEEVDRILGLELGSDDYMVKPFSPRELVARVKANLRRNEGMTPAASAMLAVDDLRLNKATYEAHWAGQKLTLTQTEFQLLRTLVTRPDKVFTRDELMDHAYPGRRVVSHRTIDSHIRRLRDKLNDAGAPGIQTLHGVGYRLKRT